MINFLNAKNYERNKFLSNYVWVVIVNWSEKPISLPSVISVYAQAWAEGKSEEDALAFEFPDEYQDIEVVCSDFPDLDFTHYKTVMSTSNFLAYYMGELFLSMNQLALFEEQVTTDDFTKDDYETPGWLSLAMSRLVLPTDRLILEPFAGSGQIAKLLPSDRLIECVEIKYSRFLQGKNNAPFATWVNGDFFNDVSIWGCDLIITNPPFSLCVEAVAKSLRLLNDNPNSRLLFLMPLDWNCSQGKSKAWDALDAHIHHIYPIADRVDYLKEGIPMSKCQKIINGVRQFKNGKALMNSGRQCYDAVFDIRLGKNHSVSTLIYKP
jgi:hypothetical protein